MRTHVVAASDYHRRNAAAAIGPRLSAAPSHRHQPAQHLAQDWRKPWRKIGTSLHTGNGRVVLQAARAPRAQEQALVDQDLEVTLQGPARSSRTQPLEFDDGGPAAVKHMPQDKSLASRQAVPAGEQVAPDGQFSSSLHLRELGSESLGEEFDPAGHVHVRLTYALKRSVESQPVAVEVLADGKESLEVVAVLTNSNARR